jgi:DNA integrity scanning protein DisA with diadenylate cyclase activity
MILLEAVLKNNSWFKGILSFIKIQLINISFADILDILLLAFMIYFAVKFLHVRRAGKLIFGVTLWILFLAFSRIFHLYAVGHILSYFLQAGIIAIVVLFQPELRDMLEKRAKKRRLNCRLCFARPELSGDNAVGVALLGAGMFRENKEE